MSKAKERAEQIFPVPQMENYDDILEYRNDRDWTFIARGAFAKGYKQALQDLMEKAKQWFTDTIPSEKVQLLWSEFEQFITEN